MSGVSAILSAAGAIVTLLLGMMGYLFGRRQSVANVESTQVKTALDLVGGLREEIGALTAQVEPLRQDLASMRRRERIQRKLLTEHEFWDKERAKQMRALGLEFPDPPTLDVDDYPDPHGPRTRATDYPEYPERRDGRDGK